MDEANTEQRCDSANATTCTSSHSRPPDAHHDEGNIAASSSQLNTTATSTTKTVHFPMSYEPGQAVDAWSDSQNKWLEDGLIDAVAPDGGVDVLYD